MAPRTRRLALGIALFAAMLALLWRVMTSFADSEHGVADVIPVVLVLGCGVLAVELVFRRRQPAPRPQVPPARVVRDDPPS